MTALPAWALEQARKILDAWAQYFEPREDYANMESAIAAALVQQREQGRDAALRDAHLALIHEIGFWINESSEGFDVKTKIYLLSNVLNAVTRALDSCALRSGAAKQTAND